MNKTVCELFAGVGGFRLGLESAGNYEVVYANQYEPTRVSQWAYDCYIEHFGDDTFTAHTYSNKDICEVETDEIPEHNLLVGGFPCQDYSVARTNAEGITGKKGVLWWEINRILKAKRPPFVLLENVNRLLKSPSNQRGRDFGVILACLQKLGYAVEWRVINAADYGFAQRRRRVFIFAFQRNTDLYKRCQKYRNSKDWVRNKGFFQDEFPLAPEMNKGKTTTIKDDIKEISDNFEFRFENTGLMIDGQIYTEKTTPDRKKPTPLSNVLEKNVDESHYLDEEDIKRFKYYKGAKKEKRVTDEGYEYNYSEGNMKFPDPIGGIPARTVLKTEGQKSRSSHVIRDPQTNKLRTLTPLEVERLNDFPDNWTNTKTMSQSFRYFVMGNALVVGLIEKMGKTLNQVFKKERQQPVKSDSDINSETA